jgi:hypothetical protein
MKTPCHYLGSNQQPSNFYRSTLTTLPLTVQYVLIIVTNWIVATSKTCERSADERGSYDL